MTADKILVIKLGAFGDVVLAFAPFAAIRAAHPRARITLLTTAPYAALARAAPWFDAVRVDARPQLWNLPGIWRLARQLRGFDAVYDLQTSARSSHYFRLAGRPPWSGIAPGCAWPHANKRRDFLHTLARQREQLEMAGITQFPPPDLGWLAGGDPGVGLPDDFAVLVPGAAPHRPAKRWPAACYAQAAAILAARGLVPVVVGGAEEAATATLIAQACPASINLIGRTSLRQLGAVLARARLALGNDTGPMHLAAILGIPSVVLFGGDSDPALTAPVGQVQVLRSATLADLPVARVAEALAALHPGATLPVA